MPRHDQLCPLHGQETKVWIHCDCDAIRRTRDDLREQVQALQTPLFRYDDPEVVHDRWKRWRADVLRLLDRGES